MSDWLRLLSLTASAGSARAYLRAGGWLLAGIILWMLWGAESGFLRWLGFLGVDGALCFGVWFYLQAPLEWSKYLFVKAAFLLLGMSRVVCKLILMIVATVLSGIYFVSPIDIIPDILLGLGWLDDALVAFGLITYAANSNYALPMPRITPEEAAEEPAWRLGIVVAIATVLTWLLRVAT